MSSQAPEPEETIVIRDDRGNVIGWWLIYPGDIAQ